MDKELVKLDKRLDYLETKARERVNDCHRKPERFEEVTKSTSIGTDLREYTPSFTSEELGITHPYDRFTRKGCMPIFFILVIGHGTPKKKKYLVSTEGYDYCRYVARFRE